MHGFLSIRGKCLWKCRTTKERVPQP